MGLFMQAHLGASSLTPVIRLALCILAQEKEEGNLCHLHEEKFMLCFKTDKDRELFLHLLIIAFSSKYRNLYAMVAYFWGGIS